MRKLLVLISLLFSADLLFAQQNIRGHVMNEQQEPLTGATVRVAGSTILSKSDHSRAFVISRPLAFPITLIVSYLGYKIKEVKLRDVNETLVVKLEPATGEMDEVKIVSTGYQNIPKERQTGSFSLIDSNLLNRKVGTGILSRLQDVVPGLVFNRNKGSAENDISIRGRNTILAKTSPLIVVDNFPYEGDILNINPGDVESITVLKDAAAASIWGARSGNGVIVITTKKGRYGQKASLSINSNINVGSKPDAFGTPTMSPAEYAAIEQRLFVKGYFKNLELSNSNLPMSPVLEILIAARDHKISKEEADLRIQEISSHDVRNDIDRFLNRKSINRQYFLNIRGGTTMQRYSISAGLDKNQLSQIGNDYQRLSMVANNSFMFFKDKLELNIGISYSQSRNTLNAVPLAISYPYQALADENGKALVLTRDFRAGFKTLAESKGLLNWEYVPLHESDHQDNRTILKDFRINLALKYKLSSVLGSELLYQYTGGQSTLRNLARPESYFVRNLINRYTQVSSDGSLQLPIPLGGILDRNNIETNTNNIRGQIVYQQNWNNTHQINAIAGTEWSDRNSLAESYRWYGYDEDHAVRKNVDYVKTFPEYANAGNNRLIDNRDSQTDLTDRYVAWYGNASYGYKDRYILSASGRLDQSNLFGVEANQKGVPLYSLGLAWVLSKEPFYDVSRIPYAKLRATWGYNGNIDKTISAYTTALYYSRGTLTGLPFANIQNPPNPELRWERVKTLNFGLDFSSKNSIISGSIEYYLKKGIDLIGDTPFPHSTGIATFKGNYAGTEGGGIDLILNSKNMDQIFKWNTSLIWSYAWDKISDYKVKASAQQYLTDGEGGIFIRPLEGKPLFALYGYRWAGLDPENGDPQGILEGQLSKEYAKIVQSAKPENILYIGSARPLYFGAVRNTFGYGPFSLSLTINFRLKYYFRRTSISYSNSEGLGGHSDYAKRWQQPGDEIFTNVPSIPLVYNANRDNLYLFSEALVERGDHIRFQDINLNYQIRKTKLSRLPFQQIEIFAFANNIGLLWRQNKSGLDPDDQFHKTIRTIAFGIKGNL